MSSAVEITVTPLYELNGTGTGLGKVLGYYASRQTAKAAAEKLGHRWYEIESDVPALLLDSGEVYLLAKPSPIEVGR